MRTHWNEIRETKSKPKPPGRLYPSELQIKRSELEFLENVILFGYHPKCKKCAKFKHGCRGQYNAPGLTYFWCGDYERRKK